MKACGFSCAGATRPCGIPNVTHAYEATRGPLPVCEAHAREILSIWPNAPVRSLADAADRAARGRGA